METNNSLDETNKLNLTIAYLNILQNIIGRMSTYVLAIKTASITTLTALLAFSASDNVCFKWWVFIIPWAFFIGFHAFFLRLERAFRKIYNLATEDNNITLASLKIDKQKIKNAAPSFIEVLCSMPLATFHSFLLIIISISYFFLGN
ncbi:hypothetical protein [Acinetobacter bereziniae]|uniref:hypothetical protein n=1 Tax=Acinetobacter bereziniae TaxID=106648 RepID=UPI0030084523